MKATQSPLAMQQTISATGWPWSRQQVARQTPASNIHGLARKLWRTQQHVGKFPTELWGLHANHTPQAQILIVPGNPGCAAFYHNFMQQLHTAFGGTADVLGVSHVGHDADDISQGAVWGLDCQVQHKVQLLQELMAPGRPPLVILAHSIGSYIMLQALQRLRSQGRIGSGNSLHNVAKVFLLMPFLRTDLSFWEQRLLATASRRHGPRLAAAAGWVQSSPGWVQDRVVQAMLPGAEPHAADSLRAALNYRGCLNNWHMAAHEFSALDRPVDWSLIRDLGSKAAVVYNPRDPWFQQYGTMHQVLPDVEAYASEGLSHAFCLSSAEGRMVSQLVHESVTSGAAAAVAGRLMTGPVRVNHPVQELREAPAAPSSA